ARVAPPGAWVARGPPLTSCAHRRGGMRRRATQAPAPGMAGRPAPSSRERPRAASLTAAPLSAASPSGRAPPPAPPRRAAQPHGADPRPPVGEQGGGDPGLADDRLLVLDGHAPGVHGRQL